MAYLYIMQINADKKCFVSLVGFFSIFLYMQINANI